MFPAKAVSSSRSSLLAEQPGAAIQAMSLVAAHGDDQDGALALEAGRLGQDQRPRADALGHPVHAALDRLRSGFARARGAAGRCSCTSARPAASAWRAGKSVGLDTSWKLAGLMAGIALGRVVRCGRGEGAGPRLGRRRIGRRPGCGRSRAGLPADAAQAVAAGGQHGDGGGRGEHAQGDQPETPAPARRAGSRGSPGRWHHGPVRHHLCGPPRRRARGRAAEPPVGHGGRGDRGEQRGDPGQLAATGGRSGHSPPGARRSGRRGAR